MVFVRRVKRDVDLRNDIHCRSCAS